MCDCGGLKFVPIKAFISFESSSIWGIKTIDKFCT